MASDSAPENLASVVDRLIDNDPEVQQEALNYCAQDLDELKQRVAGDLENLLNTRREALDELPEEFVEVNKSLVVYGLPDFSAFNLLSPNDRARLCRAIEHAITNFEVRLQRPSVTMEPPKQNERILRFRVEALLRIQPAPEPVSFDTILQLGTQQYVVER